MASHGAPLPQAGGQGGGFGRPLEACTSNAPESRAPELGKTRRERLRDLLLATEDGLTLEQIEKILEVRRSTALADLEHLRLSFRHQPATLLMVPPACTTCGFVFRLDTPRAPSRCPACKSRDLSEPIFKAEAGKA
jgi:predicted Zn-ribbon and HTH transcriptional regulator